ncbi:MAG: metallophosphoesterase [Clostridia bacterium]|nr:metallophosphoesterase [Clostridia bacterium]
MVITKYSVSAPIREELRFAFVSDIHNADTAIVLKAIEVSRVQAVLVVGDFIHDAEDYERGLSFLKKSAMLRPTFCSIGNHERKFKGDLKPLVLETGVTLLDNAATPFHDILIGGLSSGYPDGGEQGNMKKTPKPDLDFLQSFSEEEGYKLLLSHHPEYFKPYIRPLSVDLTLSGHAHGGQWRLFGIGAFAPGQGIFPRYTSGLYHGRLLVGRGLGDSHAFPPRINNAPELIFLTLTPENNTDRKENKT